MSFLNVAELAQASGKNEKTIRRAILAGRLPADKDEETGQYRIAREAGYALYPPLNGQVEAPEAPELDTEPAPADTKVPSPPAGWHEGFSDGQLDACRAIVTLDCSPDLWAALRAILL